MVLLQARNSWQMSWLRNNCYSWFRLPFLWLSFHDRIDGYFHLGMLVWLSVGQFMLDNLIHRGVNLSWWIRVHLDQWVRIKDCQKLQNFQWWHWGDDENFWDWDWIWTVWVGWFVVICDGYVGLSIVGILGWGFGRWFYFWVMLFRLSSETIP